MKKSVIYRSLYDWIGLMYYNQARHKLGDQTISKAAKVLGVSFEGLLK